MCRDLFATYKVEVFFFKQIIIQEAYCLALSKLKEAIEEPQQKSMTFINNMHSQLRELTMATTPEPDDEPGATTSSSDCAHSEETIQFRG